MKNEMPEVRMKDNFSELVCCELYLATRLPNGEVVTLLRADKEIIVFYSSHIVYVTPCGGVPDMDYINRHYKIIRKYDKGEALVLTN